MDAVSLYPNIEVEKASNIIREEVIKSNVKFAGIDMKEVGKYLSKKS